VDVWQIGTAFAKPVPLVLAECQSATIRPAEQADAIVDFKASGP
jgi:hypothetical protein